ncbi:MAG TPA: GntR family transcriptional regulator [Terracidiphilus sp.]|nr:GntR family transcriptional regulator [Terracidiphilus sp.]
MRLWLNRTGPVSLRQQLATQVVLGILCRELAPGQRLPSTRDLARRFGIHANTASAAYRELERGGWLEFRHGSGVFVRRSRPVAPPSPELAMDHALDQLIGDLIARTRRLGASPALVQDRLRRWLSLAPPSRWLLIEPEPELARIVLAELADALALPLSTCTPEDLAQPSHLSGALALVLPSKAGAVRKLLPPGAELVVLDVNPVAAALGSHLPAPTGILLAVASGWNQFQRIAQTMLAAAGFAPESLLVRDTTQPGWKRGLSAAAAVVCDAATAAQLPSKCFPIVFRLIAPSSLAQLRQTESDLTGAPAEPML